MMQMFVGREEAHGPYQDNSQASVRQVSDGDSSSLFERAQETGTGRRNSSDIDFDLTKTGKSSIAGPKSVSFAKQKPSVKKHGSKDSGKLITKQNLGQAARDFAQDEV